MGRCAQSIMSRSMSPPSSRDRDLSSTRISKLQFSGFLIGRCLTFHGYAFKHDPGRHEFFCNPHRQPRRIRSWNSADARLRTSRRYRASAWHRVRNLGRPVRGGAGIADGNTSSRRAGDDRLRALWHLRNTMGCARKIGRACEGRRLHSCPRLPAPYGNQSFETGAVSMGCRAQHGDAHRDQPTGRHLAVSRMSSRQPSSTWRTWSSHGRA